MGKFKKPNWIYSMSEKYDNIYETTAMLVRDGSNTDNCEILLLKHPKDRQLELQIRKKFMRCVDIASIPPDKYNEYTFTKIDDDEWEFPYPDGVTIKVPSAKRVQEIDNKFELLAEILTMNGISFSRPQMEVVNI